jgi:hypothetical protein
MKPDKKPMPAPETAQKTEAKSDEALSRRLLFGTGLVSLATMLGQACSGSDFSGGLGARKKKSDKEENDQDTDAGDAGDVDGEDGPDGGVDAEGDAGGGGLGNGSDTSGCHANTNSKIDLSNHPEAPDDLKPKIKFYGRDASAMIALKFETDKDIGQIMVARKDGSLLALYGTTGADKDGSGNYRPMVIDNINLKDADDLKLVLQMGADRFVVDVKKEYFTSYNGSEVVDLGGGTVPADMAANQSMTQFKESVGSFMEDPNVTYPTDGQGPRNLQTVKSGSSWTKGSTIKGTVTDIMGETIDIGGSALIEYQVFCTYVESGGKAYRTILQVA